MAEDERGTGPVRPAQLAAARVTSTTSTSRTPTAPRSRPSGSRTARPRESIGPTRRPTRRRRCGSGPTTPGPLPHWTEPPDGRGAPHPRRRPEPTTTSRTGRPAGARARSGATTAPRRRARPTTSSTSAIVSATEIRVGALDERPAPSDPFFDLEDDDEPALLPPPIVEPDPARVTAIRTRRAAPTGGPGAARPLRRRRLGRWRTERGTAGPRHAAWPSASASLLAALFLILARPRRQVPHGPRRAGPGRRGRRVLRRAPRAGLPARHAGRHRGRGRPAAGGLLAGRAAPSRS